MPRRQDIELLRVASAFGIVWFHADPRAIEVAYSGLVAFLVLSLALGGRAPLGGLQQVRSRATRLLVPWLAWFFIYGAVNVLRGGEALPSGPGPVAAVLAGPSIHLWYLPFMFLCLCAADVLQAHLSGKALAWASAVLALGLTATAPVWRPVTLTLPYPALQWADAAAPVALGLFLRHAGQVPRHHRVGLQAAIMGCCLVTAGAASIGVSYAIGFSACMLAASGRAEKLLPIRIEPLSRLMFGVYLSHSLVFIALLTWASVPGPWLAVTIFACAAALVALLRWLLPGLKDRCF